MLGRDNNRGLGIQSWEFYRHINPQKTLIVEINEKKTYRERFPDAKFCTLQDIEKNIDWLLDGVDCIVSFETWYYKWLPKIARQKGVKTFLQLNYEWLDDEADIYLAPSLWHFEDIPSPKIYLPVPINRDVIPFKRRRVAKKFFYNYGNSYGGYDRNGFEIIRKAIPLVKNDVKFIIKSQEEIPKINDPRVEYIIEDKDNYWEAYNDGDVLLFPRRYGGLSLILNEAMASGMAILSLDVKPQNLFLPNRLLVKPTSKTIQTIRKPIEVYDVEPKLFARAIDDIANKDISKYSNISNIIAENWSWQKLKKQYIKILCQN